MRSFRNLFTAAILAAIFGVGAFCLHRRSQGGELVEARKATAVPAAGSAEPAKPPEAGTEAAPATAAPQAPVAPVTPAAPVVPVAAVAPAPVAPPTAGKNGKDVAGTAKENQRMHDIPVSAEHPAKGLKIPYFDNEGKLQMTFVIGVATRLDADHIDMSDMEVETFDEEGQHEMYIDLPTSVLNLNTSVISTQKHVTIRREDFILTGETMAFNTKTKQGSLGGSVRMLIYNLDNPASKPASENPTPLQSAASSTPQPASVSKAP